MKRGRDPAKLLGIVPAKGYLKILNRFAAPTLSDGTIYVGTLTTVEAVSLQY